MTENMNLIASLVWLRRLGADEQNPQDSFRQGFVRAPGLVERCGSRAYLTPDGWDLAERMIAAAENQLAAIEACRVTQAEPEPESEPEPEPTLTESADGRREWRLNGVRHREDGPAIEWPNGDREWFLHGKLHREDGPAIELPDGYRSWWLHGKLHREDGPAIEWPDGRREWWLHGKRQPKPDKGGRQ